MHWSWTLCAAGYNSYCNFHTPLPNKLSLLRFIKLFQWWWKSCCWVVELLLCCCLCLKSVYLCSVGSLVCQSRQRCPDTWGYQQACPVPSHRWWPLGGDALSETSTNRLSFGIRHDCRQEDEERRGNLPQLLFQSDFCAAQTVWESLGGASSSASPYDKKWVLSQMET